MVSLSLEIGGKFQMLVGQIYQISNKRFCTLLVVRSFKNAILYVSVYTIIQLQIL